MSYHEHHSDQTANEAWVGVLHDIQNFGAASAPREQRTLEILAYQSRMSMRYPIVTMHARKMGYRFLAAEAAWILSGDDRVETIKQFSRDISQFSDDGVTFFGAYGPKIRNQLQHVINALNNDPDSRQAVINIWRESPPKTKDTPCTLSAQFLIRNNKLHIIDTMRSSDAWLGWVYDVFNFTMLAAYVLLHLRPNYPDLKLGALTLNAGSQHIYQRNAAGVNQVLSDAYNRSMVEVSESYPPFEPEKWFTDPDDLLENLWVYARQTGGLAMFQDLGK